MSGSTLTFPGMAGSGAYALTAPAGTSSNPGRIGSYRMDEPVRTKFHVEADLLNWTETKGQYMGVEARVQSPIPPSNFPAGYALVLRVDKSGNRQLTKLLILQINSGTTTPTELNVYPDQGYNIMTSSIVYLAPGNGGYRLVFWSEGGSLKGQLIEKSTGSPTLFYDGVSAMTNTLIVPDPGTYSSGRSGLFSYVRITNGSAQGVDPTFDNFYSAADGPDTTPPILSGISNKTVGTDLNHNDATGVALGTPGASDNSGGTVTLWNNAPSQFPLGATTVNWFGYDPSGNVATSTQTVTVIDTQAPTIICPADVSVSAGASGTAVGVNLGSPVTSDNCGVVSVTNNAPAAFPLGTTTVTWTVTDVGGNATTGTQRVTVRDTTPPTLSCPPDVTVPVNSGSTAVGVNLGSPVTGDNCSVVSVTHNAPSAFPLGTTTVTWTVTDGSGNVTTGTQRVNAVWVASGIAATPVKNGIFKLTWYGRKLQQTDDLSKPFVDVPNAVSPYTEPISQPRKFFRAW